MSKKYTAIIEKTDTGFSSYIEDLGVYTTGSSITEVNKNLIEALELLFEDQNRAFSHSDIQLEIDLKQFFQYYRIINASVLAEKIGMNKTLLSQYIQGQKKPSKKQVDKILQGIHEIGTELADMNLVY